MTTLQDTAVGPASQDEPRADRNSIACQTKCPGRLLQRGWAPQERRSLAWVTGWQASIRHDDRRSRARWNVDGDHKSPIWFSTTDGARELVCADVALSGNHCELRKRPFWKLLARADAVIDHSDASSIALHLTVDHAGSAQVRAQFLGGRAVLCPGTHVRPTHVENVVCCSPPQHGGRAAPVRYPGDWRHIEGRSPNTSIQSNSGLPQGLGGLVVAG
jgi:hypothetical protein